MKNKKGIIACLSMMLIVGILGAAVFFWTTSIVLASEISVKEGHQKKTASITIDEINFPDKNFRMIMQSKIDTNNDGILSQVEIEAVKVFSIRCSQRAKNILGYTEKVADSIGYREYNGKAVDFTGLQYFTSLENLYISNVTPVNLSLKQLTELQDVYFTSFPSVSLDFSSNGKLKRIQCSYFDSLQDVNLKGLDKLENLGINNCFLKEIDISTNTNLKNLRLADNQLTNVDVSNNTRLESIFLSNNPITKLNLRNLNELKHLSICDCAFAKINKDTLPVSSKSKLEELYAWDMPNCTVLDVSHMPALRDVTAWNNIFSTIKIGKNLNSLNISKSRRMSGLDSSVLQAPKDAKLSGLIVHGSRITKISTSHLKKLRYLDATNCRLKYINISGNTMLSGLQLIEECSESSYKLSGNINLKTIIVNKKSEPGCMEELKHVAKLNGAQITYIPSKVTGLKAVKKTKSTLKLCWNSVKGASGYKVYDAVTGKRLVTVSTKRGSGKIYKTITGLKSGQKRKYKVRAYVTVNGTNYYGDYSEVYSKATAK